jgi:hypothetical protein
LLCVAWWTCYSSGEHTWRDRSDCLVSTQEPISVVLPQIRHDLDLMVHPEPAWTGPVPDWGGVPCRIGRVETWLPIQQGPPVRPFSLLVLLPTRTVPFAAPFIHLGNQFLLEYGVQLSLDCSGHDPRACPARFVIP